MFLFTFLSISDILQTLAFLFRAVGARVNALRLFEAFNFQVYMNMTVCNLKIGFSADFFRKKDIYTNTNKTTSVYHR